MVLFRILGAVMGEDGGELFMDYPADRATAMALYVELGAAMPTE